MSLNHFYNLQFEEAYKFLKLIELSDVEEAKPLNIEDVEWQKGEDGFLDPLSLYFSGKYGESVKVYPKLYIGLAVTNDIKIMNLLYRFGKTLGLSLLKYGKINIEDERWTRYFKVVDIGLIASRNFEYTHDVGGIKFKLVDRKIVVTSPLESFLFLLYLLRPLSALLSHSPYLSFPVMEAETSLPKGFHLLNKEYKLASDFNEVFYGCVSDGSRSYIEDLRLVTIPRY